GIHRSGCNFCPRREVAFVVVAIVVRAVRAEAVEGAGLVAGVRAIAGLVVGERLTWQGRTEQLTVSVVSIGSVAVRGGLADDMVGRIVPPRISGQRGRAVLIGEPGQAIGAVVAGRAGD